MQIILTNEDIQKIGVDKLLSVLSGCTQTTVVTSAPVQIYSPKPYAPKKSRLDDFNDKFKAVCAQNKFPQKELQKFYNYYTQPSKSNPAKKALETMRYFSFDDRLNAWMARLDNNNKFCNVVA